METLGMLADFTKILLAMAFTLYLETRVRAQVSNLIHNLDVYRKELENIVKYTSHMVRERNRLFHELRDLQDNKPSK